MIRYVDQYVAIDEVLSEIAKYVGRCSTRLNWDQEPYKSDFFKIFSCAYWNAHTGDKAHKKYVAARKRNKSARIEEFVIVGERIRSFLGTAFDRDLSIELANEIASDWDEWTYAWDRYPRPPLPRPKKNQ